MNGTTPLAVVILVVALHYASAIDFSVFPAYGYAYTQEAGQQSSPSCVDFGKVTETATVICKSWGYTSIKNATYVYSPGQVSNLMLSCNGGEAKIQDCDAQPSPDCDSSLLLACD